MGDKIDPKSVKKTQDVLSKIIKKPPLTDKLLSKPPFRFLHDVCTSVIKNTGMMKGLYTDSEMSSENVKDKDSKVAFLQKAIDFVSLVTGKALAAKPSKIVAGHEPDKTNEFLQAIAEAVNKKVDNDDYVRRVLTGDTKGGSDKPAEKSEKSRSKDREQSKDRERSADKHKKPSSQTPGKKERTPPAAAGSSRRREKDDKSKDEKSGDKRGSRDRKEREGSRDREREKDKSRDKERSKDKDDDRRHKDREGRHRDKDDDKHKDREDRHKDREDRHKEREERHRERKKKRDEEDKENQEADANQMNGEAESGEPPARIPRPSSAKGSRRRQHGRRRPEEEETKDDESGGGQLNGHVGEDDLPPQVAASKSDWNSNKLTSADPRRRMARPSSARPAPPRVKKNEQVPDEPVLVGSSKVPNIISDNKGDSDDDDIFVTKDDEEPQPEPQEPVARRRGSDSEEDDGGDHGGLVKKIMDTKAQLEHGSQTKEAQVTKKTEIERSSQVSDVQRRKEREMVKKEIDKLRGSIQTLTRSVNPLGKILDFVQEDMDSMQKELDVWRKENRENQVALQREQSITDSSVEPLKAHLGELDNNIKDQLDLIAAVKSNILKNDDKISKMLGSITKS